MTPSDRRRTAHQTTCKVCGRAEKFDFVVSDSVWRSVVPHDFLSKVVCLYCFDELAREAGIRYAQSVSAVYFAGSRGSFVLTVSSAVDLP